MKAIHEAERRCRAARWSGGAPAAGGGPEELFGSRVRLLAGLMLATLIMAALVMAANPGARGGRDLLLSQGMLTERTALNIDSQALATRVVEQRFQLHTQEAGEELGEIPYVEVWVLNDPFYPLMGEVGDLRSSDGTLASKEWQMRGFPDYESGGQGTGAAPPPAAPPSSLPVTAGMPQRVVLVQEIYEIRGIRYANVKVNDQVYERLKAGSDFGEVFRLQEIKDARTAVVLCGDESYELKVDQLRKI